MVLCMDVPWWMFWNPCSGVFGGLLFAHILFVDAILFAVLGKYARKKGWL